MCLHIHYVLYNIFTRCGSDFVYPRFQSYVEFVTEQNPYLNLFKNNLSTIVVSMYKNKIKQKVSKLDSVLR